MPEKILNICSAHSSYSMYFVGKENVHIEIQLRKMITSCIKYSTSVTSNIDLSFKCDIYEIWKFHTSFTIADRCF